MVAAASGGSLAHPRWHFNFRDQFRHCLGCLSLVLSGAVANHPWNLPQHHDAGVNMILTWPLGRLLEATNLAGPWTPIGMNNMTGPQLFFKLSTSTLVPF